MLNLIDFLSFFLIWHKKGKNMAKIWQFLY